MLFFFFTTVVSIIVFYASQSPSSRESFFRTIWALGMAPVIVAYVHGISLFLNWNGAILFSTLSLLQLGYLFLKRNKIGALFQVKKKNLIFWVYCIGLITVAVAISFKPWIQNDPLEYAQVARWIKKLGIFVYPITDSNAAGGFLFPGTHLPGYPLLIDLLSRGKDPIYNFGPWSFISTYYYILTGLLPFACIGLTRVERYISSFAFVAIPVVHYLGAIGHIDLIRIFFLVSGYLAVVMFWKKQKSHYAWIAIISAFTSYYFHSLGLLAIFFVGLILIGNLKKNFKLTFTSGLWATLSMLAILAPFIYLTISKTQSVFGDASLNAVFSQNLLGSATFIHLDRGITSTSTIIQRGLLQVFFLKKIYGLIGFSMLFAASSFLISYKRVRDLKRVLILCFPMFVYYGLCIVGAAFGSLELIKNPRYTVTISLFFGVFTAIGLVRWIKFSWRNKDWFEGKVLSFYHRTKGKSVFFLSTAAGVVFAIILFYFFIQSLENARETLQTWPPRYLKLFVKRYRFWVALSLLIWADINLSRFFIIKNLKAVVKVHHFLFVFILMVPTVSITQNLVFFKSYKRQVRSFLQSKVPMDYYMKHNNYKIVADSNESTDKSFKFITWRQSDFGAFTKRNFLNHSDPALVDFYKAKNLDEAFDRLRDLNIRYLHIPPSNFNSTFTNSFLKEITSSLDTSRLLEMNNRGIQVLEIGKKIDNNFKKIQIHSQKILVPPKEQGLKENYLAFKYSRYMTPDTKRECLTIEKNKLYWVEMNISGDGFFDFFLVFTPQDGSPSFTTHFLKDVLERDGKKISRYLKINTTSCLKKFLASLNRNSHLNIFEYSVYELEPSQ